MLHLSKREVINETIDETCLGKHRVQSSEVDGPAENSVSRCANIAEIVAMRHRS